jgi:hypothetical protein
LTYTYSTYYTYPIARLTVSVPDELHQRLEKWRDRLNVSRVCQEALAREIRRLEEVPHDAVALGDLIERLSQEKADAGRRWFAQGVTDAMSWSRGASYVDLRATAEDGARATPAGRTAVQAAIERHADVAGFEVEDFVAGWCFAAAEVWARVKSKI